MEYVHLCRRMPLGEERGVGQSNMSLFRKKEAIPISNTINESTIFIALEGASSPGLPGAGTSSRRSPIGGGPPPPWAYRAAACPEKFSRGVWETGRFVHRISEKQWAKQGPVGTGFSDRAILSTIKGILQEKGVRRSSPRKPPIQVALARPPTFALAGKAHTERGGKLDSRLRGNDHWGHF